MSGDDRCLNCNATVRRIRYALGERWMHVDPSASFPTERKGTAWRYCRAQVATPTETRESAGSETRMEPCDECGAGVNEPCRDGCAEDQDCRSLR